MQKNPTLFIKLCLLAGFHVEESYSNDPEDQDESAAFTQNSISMETADSSGE